MPSDSPPSSSHRTYSFLKQKRVRHREKALRSTQVVVVLCVPNKRARFVKYMTVQTFGAFSSLVVPSYCRARELVLRAALRNSIFVPHNRGGGGGGRLRGPFRRRGSSFIPNKPWSYSKKEEESGGTDATAAKMSGSAPYPRSASAAGGGAASVREVSERLVRYWDAECREGRRAPEPLAARQASVLVPLVSSAWAAAADDDDDEGGNNNSGGGGGGNGSSAVRDEGIHVLLCTRSARLSSHAGEVCLPAGNTGAGGGTGAMDVVQSNVRSPPRKRPKIVDVRALRPLARHTLSQRLKHSGLASLENALHTLTCCEWLGSAQSNIVNADDDARKTPGCEWPMLKIRASAQDTET